MKILTLPRSINKKEDQEGPSLPPTKSATKSTLASLLHSFNPMLIFNEQDLHQDYIRIINRLYEASCRLKQAYQMEQSWLAIPATITPTPDNHFLMMMILNDGVLRQLNASPIKAAQMTFDHHEHDLSRLTHVVLNQESPLPKDINSIIMIYIYR